MLVLVQRATFAREITQPQDLWENGFYQCMDGYIQPNDMSSALPED